MSKPISERNPIAVALVGLAVLAVIALVAFFTNDLPIIGGGTTYTAYFTEAAGLQPGDEVAVAGVPVGRVTGVSLAGDRVLVAFQVKNAWLGNASRVSIDIKTLLGDKYLAVDPLGRAAQDPGQTIPAARTSSPYDVTQAFSGVGQDISKINTSQLAKSLETIAATFRNSPPSVRSSLHGLAALSRSIAAKDVQVTKLLAGTRKVTGDLSKEDARFQALFSDGNLLLAELRQRQAAIHALLTGTQALATQLSGLVNDDNATLGPALSSLSQVTAALQANQANLARALALAGPYYRLLGNTLGNGRWFDAYLCGLVPNFVSAAQGPHAAGLHSAPGRRPMTSGSTAPAVIRNAFGSGRDRLAARTGGLFAVGPGGTFRTRRQRRIFGCAAAAVAVVIVVGGFLLYSAGHQGKQITAYFRAAVGVYPGSSVRILGVPVGTVDSGAALRHPGQDHHDDRPRDRGAGPRRGGGRGAERGRRPVRAACPGLHRRPAARLRGGHPGHQDRDSAGGRSAVRQPEQAGHRARPERGQQAWRAERSAQDRGGRPGRQRQVLPQHDHRVRAGDGYAGRVGQATCRPRSTTCSCSPPC